MLRPDDHADLTPDAAAVIVPATGQRISYRTMVDKSRRLANVLRSHGLVPGDHVAILMTTVPEYFEVVWAARRAGYFYTAINWHLTPGEVRYMLENSESKALIVSADLADVASQAAAGLPGLSLRLLVGAVPANTVLANTVPAGALDGAGTARRASRRSVSRQALVATRYRQVRGLDWPWKCSRERQARRNTSCT